MSNKLGLGVGGGVGGGWVFGVGGVCLGGWGQTIYMPISTYNSGMPTTRLKTSYQVFNFK